MLKVFLVEDEVLIREGLRDKIPWEQYGFRLVGEAADGEVALPLIRKTRPDVLITDIKMPFMDGLALSRIVREELPGIKIIIISGYDDFEYAREAISVGVDQYLLKPITRTNLRKVLQELKDKIEQEKDQKDYQMQLQNELHEYEQFSRRRFFEKVFDGGFSAREIYEEAGKFSLDLSASCYNLMFLYIQEKSGKMSTQGMERFLQKQDEVLHYFLRHPQYILFRWNVNSYGVLVKGEEYQMEMLIRPALDHVRKVCAPEEEYLDWYIAAGHPVERLSLLSICYQQTNHYFACRFILPDVHILTEETLEDYLLVPGSAEKSIEGIDSAKMSPGIVLDFLVEGSEKEIDGFVESYLQNIEEALKSRMFRNYVVLNIRFAAISYIESAGMSKEAYFQRMGKYAENIHIDPEEIPLYFRETLQAVIGMRDEERNSQSSGALKRALEYIDKNYSSDSLSLSSVACAIHVSANYLSSIFSQNVQKTFTEYVTEKRMERARKLLRSTDKSTAVIAQEVGYKDAHYFSFVFRKTQECSPREYRNHHRD